MQTTKQTSRRKTTTGIFFILFGAVLLFHQLNIISLFTIRDMWPFIFIVIGIAKLLAAEDRREFAAGIWWTFLGAWIYISVNHLWGLGFHDTWPAMVIAAGFSIIWKSMNNNSCRLVKE